MHIEKPVRLVIYILVDYAVYREIAVKSPTYHIKRPGQYIQHYYIPTYLPLGYYNIDAVGPCVY